VSQKKIPNIFDCNLKKDYQTLIIIGMNIPDTTGQSNIETVYKDAMLYTAVNKHHKLHNKFCNSHRTTSSAHIKVLSE